MMIACFLLGVAVDWLWAEYIKGVSGTKPWRAAAFAASIVAAGALTTVIYVQDHWAIIPAALGAACGTWLSVWRHRER